MENEQNRKVFDSTNLTRLFFFSFFFLHKLFSFSALQVSKASVDICLSNESVLKRCKYPSERYQLEQIIILPIQVNPNIYMHLRTHIHLTFSGRNLRT